MPIERYRIALLTTEFIGEHAGPLGRNSIAVGVSRRLRTRAHRALQGGIAVKLEKNANCFLTRYSKIDPETAYADGC